ncbi:hypothetical protein SAMN05421578_10617 [Paenibacillus macquariensis]|uniref:Uncharacterized protein n=1 Tax=Paenibacillus macquariensis TaxID=948756 RepID=A0ABY1JZ09_9BACL|nr:hypothetical protein SAMN05421578_10617 [Paenibacillus macquariensis]
MKVVSLLFNIQYALTLKWSDSDMIEVILATKGIFWITVKMSTQLWNLT